MPETITVEGTRLVINHYGSGAIEILRNPGGHVVIPSTERVKFLEAVNANPHNLKGVVQSPVQSDT